MMPGSTPYPDDAVLLCLPHGLGPVAAGSLRKLCDVCHQPITASRASLEAVIAAATEHQVKWWLICLECAPKVVPQDSELIPPTAAQRAEIRAELQRMDDEDSAGRN